MNRKFCREYRNRSQNEIGVYVTKLVWTINFKRQNVIFVKSVRLLCYFLNSTHLPAIPIECSTFENFLVCVMQIFSPFSCIFSRIFRVILFIFFFFGSSYSMIYRFACWDSIYWRFLKTKKRKRKFTNQIIIANNKIWRRARETSERERREKQ